MTKGYTQAVEKRREKEIHGYAANGQQKEACSWRAGAEQGHQKYKISLY